MPLSIETKIRLVILKGFLLIWFFVGIVIAAFAAIFFDLPVAFALGSALGALVAGWVTWLTVKSRIRMAQREMRRDGYR